LTDGHVLSPIEPVGPSRIPRIVLCVVLALAVLTGVAVRVIHEMGQPDSCGAGVVKVGGSDECVGVSDGSYRFVLGDATIDGDLGRLEDLIAEQNASIGKARHVTIAYALPMPWNGLGTLTTISVLHQLAGAWAAQSAANAGPAPLKVRLLIANFGHDGVGWQQVLTGLTTADDPADVVVGLGQSIRNTYQLAGGLANAGRPMVGAMITADDLNGHTFPNLYRIGPTNTQQIAAAIAYLQGAFEESALDRVNGVYVIASGTPQDNYVVNLTKAFKQSVPHAVTLTYDGQAPGWSQALDTFAASMCGAHPSAVYVAARAAQLQYFVEQVGAHCDSRMPLTVLSGDDAAALVNSTDVAFTRPLRESALTMVYTAIGYPGASTGSRPPRLTELRGRLDPVNIATDLTDGSAMSAFDAVELAVGAATFVISALPPGTSGGNLFNGFAQFNRANPFCGATGPVALVTDDGPRRGDAFEKPIPVLRLLPGKATSLKLLYTPTDDPPPVCHGGPAS
jgi:hypothetical protein